ncbi:MAG: AsmA family protein [Pseudomonadota bacterium]
MGKLLRLVLAAASLVVLLLVIVVIAVTLFFDPNDYRDEIAEALSDATGRDVALAGDLSLSVFPWLAIETAGITVSDAPGFGDEPMFELGSASASVRLMPLMSGSVEVGMVTVKDLAVRLTVAPDGRNNWSDIGAADSVDTASGDTADAAAAGDAGTDLDLKIAGFILDNATIVYDDQQSGSRYDISEAGIQISGVDLTTPTDVVGGLKLQSAADKLEADVDFSATVAFGEAQDGEQPVNFTGLDLETTVSTPDLASPQQVMLQAASLSINGAANTLSVKDMVLKAAGVSASTTLDGTLEPLALTGAIDVAPFAPKRTMEAVIGKAPVLTDPDALDEAAFSADLRLTDAQAELTNLLLRIDSTELKGSVSIADFETQALRFDLSGSDIDLDRYLPPADETVADDAGDNLAESALPVDLIQGLDARGRFRMQRVTLGGLPFDNLDLGLNVANNTARLQPIKATVLQGTYSGDVSIDARNDVPRLSLNESVDGLNMGELARLLWEQDNIEGTFAGNFKLAGLGVTLSDIRRSLDGDVRFSLTDGALAGTDIWYQIRRARALFKQEAAPSAPSPARTEFSELRGTAVVSKGVARNDDFYAALPFLQLTGAGEVDLGDATIDYGMNARVLERPEFLTNVSEAELDEYTEAVIPMKITGPVASPSIKPDVAGMAKAAAERKIQEERDRAEDRVRDALKDKEDELKKRLKDIF